LATNLTFYPVNFYCNWRGFLYLLIEGSASE
jgi:hypothetical protein